MKIRKHVALTAAFVAVASAAACTSTSEEGGGEAPSTTAAKSAADFSRTLDLGNGYRLSLDSPAGVGVADVPEKVMGGPNPYVVLVSLEGHDYSDQSSAEMTKVLTTPKLEITNLAFTRGSCLDFDTFRNREDTVDATSPLNGQPVSYLKITDLDALKGKKLANRVVAENVRGSSYMLKLGGSPCEALIVVTTWMKGSPTSPLEDFGYSVLVEGNGALTGPA